MNYLKMNKEKYIMLKLEVQEMKIIFFLKLKILNNGVMI